MSNANFDFNDAAPQSNSFDLIPNDALVRVIGILRPGGANRPGTDDGGFVTQSRKEGSDVMYLSWEFTVADGPYARRKFWQNMTVHGGEVDDKGQSKSLGITKSTIRAILNSARAINPEDESERARAGRRINSWGDMSPIEFACKVRIAKAKPGSGYQDQNAIGTVIEPGHKDYAALMSGGVIVPAGGPAFAAPAATPGWAGNGASAPAAHRAPPPPNAAPAAAGLPAWAR